MTESELRQKIEDGAAFFETERQRIFREHQEKIEGIRFRTMIAQGAVVVIGILSLVAPLIIHWMRK